MQRATAATTARTGAATAEGKAREDSLGIFGSHLLNLFADPSDTGIASFRQNMRLLGVSDDILDAELGDVSALPVEQRGAVIQSRAMRDPVSLKALEAAQPKYDPVNLGGQTNFVQTNSLVPGFTAPTTLQNTMSPEQTAAADLARYKAQYPDLDIKITPGSDVIGTNPRTGMAYRLPVMPGGPPPAPPPPGMLGAPAAPGVPAPAGGGVPGARAPAAAAPTAPDYLQTLKGNENATGDPAARNRRSTAMGNGQFIDETWLAMISQRRPDLAQGKTPAQILALRADPQLSDEMILAYGADNAALLDRRGFLPTNANVALAHRFGPDGASNLLSQPADRPMSEVASAQVINANPDLRGKTVGQVVGQFNQQYGAAPFAGGAAPAAGAPAVAPAVAGAPAGATAPPGSFENVTALAKQTSAREALKTLGYDPATGMDRVARLIPQSTSGMVEGAASAIKGAITGTSTPGREALAALDTIISRLVLELAGGKLGVGFSNEDRRFLETTLGKAGDVNKPWNERLAAWRDAQGILVANAGYPPKAIPEQERAPRSNAPGTGAGGGFRGANATPEQRQRARALLLSDPSTAPYYDSNFGPGEAAKVLAEERGR
jgi:hypothetical protein